MQQGRRQCHDAGEETGDHHSREGGDRYGPSFHPIDKNLYSAVQVMRRCQMNTLRPKGAEEARNQLPDLLDAAEEGQSTIITRHGRPVAALVPIDAYGAATRQQPLMPMEGSGRGLWGRDGSRTISRLRDEWSR